MVGTVLSTEAFGVVFPLCEWVRAVMAMAAA